MKKTGSATLASAPMVDRDYQAEDDHRTLTRADEIQTDARRMAGVRRHHRKTVRALSRVGRTLRK